MSGYLLACSKSWRECCNNCITISVPRYTSNMFILQNILLKKALTDHVYLCQKRVVFSILVYEFLHIWVHITVELAAFQFILVPNWLKHFCNTLQSFQTLFGALLATLLFFTRLFGSCRHFFLNSKWRQTATSKMLDSKTKRNTQKQDVVTQHKEFKDFETYDL